MNRVVSLSLALLCLTALVNTQFGPPVNWDKPILKRDGTTKVCRQYATSFESWKDFDGFDITPLNNGAGSAHGLSTNRVRSGKYAHMSAITAIEDGSHQGYPSIQLYKNTQDAGGFSGAVWIEVWIWMDIAVASNQWVTLGRLSPHEGPTPGRQALSLDIGPDGYLQYGNTPKPGLRFMEYKNDVNKFPRQQWVNITMYVDFNPNNGYTALWQDGKLQAVAKLEYEGVGRLNQLHFGLFAANLIPSGVIYNDDLTITEISRAEDVCPATPWTMTLPPTNAPETTKSVDTEEVAWVTVADNASGMLRTSSALVAVCILLVTYMFL